MKKTFKILILTISTVLAIFVGLFTIYFFNLDMKLVALIDPLLQKWYDELPRKQSV